MTHTSSEKDRKAAFKFISDELKTEHDLRQTLHSVIRLVREISGCEAVAVRLHRDGDFPYFVSEGFSTEFIAHENSLCAHDPDGRRKKDGDGKSYALECMCGKVIKGDHNPEKPFFTGKGSFWTNNFAMLLHTPEAESMLLETRGYCPASGYRSVALIPIKTGSETIGLIQINHPESGIFTHELIGELEKMGSRVGTAIQNSLLYEELRVFV